MRRIAGLLMMLAASGMAVAATSLSARQWQALRSMHADFVEAFAGSKGFGPARITPTMAKVHQYQFRGIGDSGRCVLEVELVGIARHDPPVVHASGPFGFSHLSRDEIMPGNRPAERGLLAWEKAAIARLADGQSLAL